ncbi:hypothetical protein G5I_02572 [Acromyrmex echinatior]|uniref:Uncharacterized protein n=1 Tax=Acromyrmex echinatior TaxID=103372 RepID=F4WAN4_ACREC|nr:hypothetical protein G5I_02572 [Acromyrmex echinatior]
MKEVPSLRKGKDRKDVTASRVKNISNKIRVMLEVVLSVVLFYHQIRLDIGGQRQGPIKRPRACLHASGQAGESREKEKQEVKEPGRVRSEEEETRSGGPRRSTKKDNDYDDDDDEWQRNNVLQDGETKATRWISVDMTRSNHGSFIDPPDRLRIPSCLTDGD